MKVEIYRRGGGILSRKSKSGRDFLKMHLEIYRKGGGVRDARVKVAPLNKGDLQTATSTAASGEMAKQRLQARRNIGLIN